MKRINQPSLCNHCSRCCGGISFVETSHLFATEKNQTSLEIYITLKSSRNNLIFGKTRSSGTSWRNAQFLHSKRLLVSLKDQRVDHSRTLPKQFIYCFSESLEVQGLKSLQGNTHTVYFLRDFMGL